MTTVRTRVAQLEKQAQPQEVVEFYIRSSDGKVKTSDGWLPESALPQGPHITRFMVCFGGTAQEYDERYSPGQEGGAE